MTNPFARYPSLKDRPVIISGGASGIGESLVREFAAGQPRRLRRYHGRTRRRPAAEPTAAGQPPCASPPPTSPMSRPTRPVSAAFEAAHGPASPRQQRRQ